MSAPAHSHSRGTRSQYKKERGRGVLDYLLEVSCLRTDWGTESTITCTHNLRDKICRIWYLYPDLLDSSSKTGCNLTSKTVQSKFMMPSFKCTSYSEKKKSKRAFGTHTRPSYETLAKTHGSLVLHASPVVTRPKTISDPYSPKRASRFPCCSMLHKVISPCP